MPGSMLNPSTIVQKSLLRACIGERFLCAGALVPAHQASNQESLQMNFGGTISTAPIRRSMHWKARVRPTREPNSSRRHLAQPVPLDPKCLAALREARSRCLGDVDTSESESALRT